MSGTVFWRFRSAVTGAVVKTAPDTVSAARGELVILVHGLGGGRWWMRRIERRLQRDGFDTLNWGYRSYLGGVETHGVRLLRLLEQLDGDSHVSRFHLVTHSMGGVLARFVLAERKFNKLQRVVMLGPPHAGSRVAANLAPVLGRILLPLIELSDNPGSLVNRLPEPQSIEVGVIAARRDRVVHVDSTRLANLADHITVDSGHNSMLFRSDVADYVARFLQVGHFDMERNGVRNGVKNRH